MGRAAESIIGFVFIHKTILLILTTKENDFVGSGILTEYHGAIVQPVFIALTIFFTYIRPVKRHEYGGQKTFSV